MRFTVLKMSGSLAKRLMAAAGVALLAAGSAVAGPILTTTDDGYTANDANRGPTQGGDRNEASAFVEVRHLTTTIRKRIGYFKYNITGVDPSTFASATLSGGFSTTAQDGPGTWNVYGINDGVTNTDDVPDGSFGEANWTEGISPINNLNYAKGLGVDNSILTTDPAQGIDLAEVTLLGTITLPGNVPFVSDPTSLPLGAFLSADTNGVVTFMFADANATGSEWRITARENTAAGNGTDAEGGVLLSFVPEPTSVCLALMGLCGVAGIRRNRRSA